MNDKFAKLETRVAALEQGLFAMQVAFLKLVQGEPFTIVTADGTEVHCNGGVPPDETTHDVKANKGAS